METNTLEKQPTGIIQLTRNGGGLLALFGLYADLSFAKLAAFLYRKICCFFLVSVYVPEMSHLMGKPTICIGENKDTDQLRGDREADQRLCFRYSDSTIPLLLKSEISSF